MKFVILLFSVLLSSSVFENGDVEVNLPGRISSATVTSVSMVNDQIIVKGTNLNVASGLALKGTSFDEAFTIESKSATQIIANSKRAISIDVTKVFDLILSDAQGAAAFPISFDGYWNKTGSEVSYNGNVDISNGAFNLDPVGYGGNPLLTFGTTSPSSFLMNADDTGSFQIRRAGSNWGPQIRMGSSWGAVGSPSVSTAGQYLGAISFEAWTGAPSSTNGFNPGANISGISSGTTSATSAGAHLAFGTTPAGSLGLAERMRIIDTGEVGIGTATPVSALTVLGNRTGTPAGTNGAFLSVLTTGAVTFQDTATIAGGTATSVAGTHFGVPVFMAANAGVTTTTAATVRINGPARPSTNQTFGNSYGLLINSGTAAGGGGTGSAYGLAVAAPSGAPANYAAVFTGGHVGIGLTNPDERLVVFNGTTTGKYTSTGWTHVSDKRLKQEINPLTNSLEKIVKLKGVEFKFKKDAEKKKQIGLIAQDVEPIFPEVVETDKQGFKSMVYGNLIAPIIEAIKTLNHRDSEQTRKVASLEKSLSAKDQKIEALQNENDEIKSYLCSKDPKAKICL